MGFSCRVCKSPTISVISYGRMPLANAFLYPKDYNKEYFFELAIEHCPTCKMLQLKEQPNPQEMFHDEYAFFSGTSKKMEMHFKRKAESHIENFMPNTRDSFIVELGSNDGIFLKNFAGKNIKHLGVEPSGNVAKIAKEKDITTIVDFFSHDLAEKILKEFGPADIITASNVMCHIPDLNSVGRGVDTLLKEKGIFEFEDPYLGAMIEKTSYDQIYDEHVYIFSVTSVINTFRSHGLDVFHVEPLETHGGSMRYYLGRSGVHPIRESVYRQLNEEKRIGLSNIETYHQFAQNCERNKKDLVELLTRLKDQGNSIVGYGATSKSTTILNYCGISEKLISCIYDTTPIKHGKQSPGMHIPIISYEHFKADCPDYSVLFAWNHAEEIFEKEKEYTAGGKKWILFCPTVKIF